MRRPLLFFVGTKRMQVDASDASALMNLCRQEGYVYRDFSFCGDVACFSCSYATAKKLRRACQIRGISIESVGAYGLPALLWRNRHRYGVLVGLLLFIGITFGSGRVLWEIRVSGNQTLASREVIEVLRTCGMQVGDVLSELDTAVLENRVMIESDEISWISINLIGTVAEVEIREVEPPPKEEHFAAANLVASRAGVIEWFEDVRGNVVVKIGDPIEAGDLLVGGLYDVEGGGIRYTCARGKVYARTERDFSIQIPLKEPKKVYTGEVRIEKYWIFFEKEIKIFGNNGNLQGSYDIINTVESLELGDTALPVGIRTLRYLPYELREVERSEADAEDLAYYRLRCQIEGALPEGFLLRKHLTWETRDGSFYLHCRAEYIENIAQTKEIELDLLP